VLSSVTATTALAVTGPMPGAVRSRATGIRLLEDGDAIVGRVDLRVQGYQHLEERLQFLEQLGRRLQCGDLLLQQVRRAALNPQTVAPGERLDDRSVTRPRADQCFADRELGADVPPRVAGTMCLSICSEPARLHQRVGIASVRFHTTVSCGVHGCEVWVSYDHLVGEAFEVARDPLALGARLEKNTRGRAITEDCAEPVAARDDATLLDPAVLVCDAELALALVKIESYRSHWLASRCLCAPFSDGEHVFKFVGLVATTLTVEASRFIPTNPLAGTRH
jgi:hypothetical protein